MLKILFLQRHYNISDDNSEYAMLDRLNFIRFPGLGINDRVPDAKTIWPFRDLWAKTYHIKIFFACWSLN
jgi:IS5 family transposase